MLLYMIHVGVWLSIQTLCCDRETRSCCSWHCQQNQCELGTLLETNHVRCVTYRTAMAMAAHAAGQTNRNTSVLGLEFRWHSAPRFVGYLQPPAVSVGAHI